MDIRPLPLERIGQRFSIRLHDPAGGYRDVVGHLKTASSLINRKGQEITFDPEQIFVWREIIERPTLAGKGAPLTLRVLELDQICNLTWQLLITWKIQGGSCAQLVVLLTALIPFFRWLKVSKLEH
jgi:hypothetical protein